MNVYITYIDGKIRKIFLIHVLSSENSKAMKKNSLNTWISLLNCVTRSVHLLSTMYIVCFLIFFSVNYSLCEHAYSIYSDFSGL